MSRLLNRLPRPTDPDEPDVVQTADSGTPLGRRGTPGQVSRNKKRHTAEALRRALGNGRAA